MGQDVSCSPDPANHAPIMHVVTFPKDLLSAKEFALLGLGDIVLPGLPRGFPHARVSMRIFKEGFQEGI